MDIAVFSDIHGNYVAFQECLEYALNRTIETFIFLGDYLGEFSYPQKTMDMIYSMAESYTCFFVRGNKEDYWINRRADRNCEWKSGNATVGAMKHCYAQLTEKDIDFFETLPICLEIKLKGTEPLLACHGAPAGNNVKMLPDHDGTKSILEQCKHKYILCGHTHIQRIIEHNGTIALNPGSIGVSLHGGGKAQFMILHQDTHGWSHEFIALDYDKEKVIKELRESGLEDIAPYWCQVTKHMMLTGTISHGTVLARAVKLCAEERGSCDWYSVPDEYWEKAIAELITA